MKHYPFTTRTQLKPVSFAVSLGNIALRTAIVMLATTWIASCGEQPTDDTGYRSPTSADVQLGLATEPPSTASDNQYLEDISDKTRVTLQEESPEVIDVNAVTLETVIERQQQNELDADENDIDAICDIVVNPDASEDADHDHSFNGNINIRENVIVCLEPGHYGEETILSGGWAGTPRKIIAKPSLESPCDIESEDAVIIDGLVVYADYVTLERLIIDNTSGISTYGEENITTELCSNQ